MDAALDKGSSGPRWLADPEIAAYTECPILRCAELGRYVLHAYVIMPNHVHMLLEPRVPLAKITGVLKGVAARDANATLDRIGRPFWQDETFDHWLRNPAEFERIRHYIEWNPVSAGLAAKPEHWEWSSASSKFLSGRPILGCVLYSFALVAQPFLAVFFAPLPWWHSHSWLCALLLCLGGTAIPGCVLYSFALVAQPSLAVCFTPLPW
ncbi:MAG: transposase, partial [Candidatus Acidiferrales bacterium]